MKKNTVIIATAILLSNIATAAFFNAFYLQTPILVQFRPMIVPRSTQKPKQPPKTNKINTPTGKPVGESIRVDLVMAQTDPSDKDIAAYIKSKSWDYSTAIRLAKSENYWNLTQSFVCSRTHTNKNGSIDVGIFQINSIHQQNLAKLGLTMDDMKDCYKNIDYAYKMWKDQGGFQAWSAYTNGSYLTHSEI